MSEWSQSFQEAFCKRYRCSPAAYPRKAFLKTLYRRARWIVPLLQLTRRNYFRLDHDLIGEVGASRNWSDFNSAISNYVQSNMLRSGFLRRDLKFRVSCNRLKRLARKLFGERGSGRPREKEPIPEPPNEALRPAAEAKRARRELDRAAGTGSNPPTRD